MMARGAAELVYRRIEPYCSDYVGKIFEDICKQYLWKQMLEGSVWRVSGSGTLVGDRSAVKSQAEIDIMGDQDGDTALFGECKWTKEKVDTGVQ